MDHSPVEVSFEVDGLTYAGLSWGDPGAPLILALHGWLDNALSFAELGPRLHGHRVIALDLSGHGHSSHRSADATYNVWDDLPQLAAIVDQLGQEQLVLMGHSRGAGIALQLAVVLAERCQQLIMIDGLLPAFMDDRNAGEQVRKFVHERKKYARRGERFFASIEEFVERRKQYGFSSDSARDLVPRALEPVADGYRLLSDPRLFGASASWFDAEDRLALYRAVTAPVLGIHAEEGLFSRLDIAKQMLEEAGSSLKHFSSTTIAGSHHLHMEASAGLVAQRISQFLGTGS